MTVDRWKLTSYCLCNPSATRGHFEKSSDELAVWVVLADHEAEVAQLRGNLSLAEEGLANYAQENAQLRALLTQAGSGDEGRYQREIERLRAAQQHMYSEGKRFEGLWRDAAQALERIEQERLTWAMVCECYCPACTALDKLIRGHLPQSEGTK